MLVSHHSFPSILFPSYLQPAFRLLSCLLSSFSRSLCDALNISLDVDCNSDQALYVFFPTGPLVLQPSLFSYLFVSDSQGLQTRRYIHWYAIGFRSLALFSLTLQPAFRDTTTTRFVQYKFLRTTTSITNSRERLVCA